MFMTISSAFIMRPGDSLWESNIRKRKLEGSFQSYKRDANEIEFPNPAEGIDAIYEVTGDEVTLRMESPRPEIIEKTREELRQETERIHNEDEARKKR